MTATTRRRRWLVAGGSLAVLCAAVLGASWPLPARLDSALPGTLDHPGLQGDLFFQWNLWRQMQEGDVPDHLRTEYLRVPEGQAFEAKVGFSLNLALFAILMVPFDLLTAHNLAVLLILLLNGVAMYGAVRSRRGPVLLALGAALAYALGPFVFLKMDQGFVQKSMIFTVPPFVAWVVSTLERFRWRTALGAGAMVLVATSIYPPYAVYHLLFAAVLTPVGLAQRGRGRAAVALVGGLVALAAVLLLALPPVEGPTAGSADAVGAAVDVPDGILDPTRPLRWHPYHQVPPGAPEEYVHALPMGLPLLAGLLCLIAAVGRRPGGLPLLVGAGVFTLLMAGPYLSRGGEALTIGGSPIPLPLALVSDTPFALAFNYPVRMAPWIVTAVLLGAAQGGSWVAGWLGGRWTGRGWVPMAVTAVIGLALFGEARLPFPEYGRLRVEEVSAPAHCELIPEGASVLHLPYFAPGPHVYEFAAVLCDRPTMNSSLAAPPPVRIPLPGDPEVQRRAFLGQLAEVGVSHILVHPAYYGAISRAEGHNEPSLGPPEDGARARDVEHWLVGLCGPPEQFPDEGVHAYRVPGS